MSRPPDLSDFSWVRLSFVDVFGASHSVEVPAARLLQALEQGGVPFDGSSLEGRARLIEVDMRLRPDLGTLVPLGAGVARAVCVVCDRSGEPWPGDPRTALTTIVQRAGELGRGFAAAAELEFYLFDDDRRPIDAGGYFNESEGPGMTVCRAAADRLVSYGVAIESAHHEAGPGQYELDLAAAPPLALADALVLAKHVVREAAAEAGVGVTFMPRPFLDEAGSGLHVHQHLGKAQLAGTALSERGRAFLAGQLTHARGLLALAAPTVNSYKRLHSGPEAPSAAFWAHTNRAALLRLSPNMTGGTTLEFRGSDPSANPYLLLGGLIVAGAHGIEVGLEPSAAFEEEASGFDPAAVDSTEFAALPRDLDDALDALLADDALVDAFDPRLLSRLVDGRRAEAAEYRSQVTPWELQRYLDEA